MKARKTWREKLMDNKDLPKVAEIDGKLSKRWGYGTFVVPAPVEVKELMDQVPRGRLTSINELREALARKHHTSIACPITTGIFAWIAAHAAEESAAEGAKNITPYWRTLKSGGELNPKYPGGIESLRKRLEAEGHKVIQRGKRYIVANFPEARLSFEKAALPTRRLRDEVRRGDAVANYPTIPTSPLKDFGHAFLK